MAITFSIEKSPLISEVRAFNDEGEKIGYLRYVRSGDGVFVDDFWVHEDYRTVGNARKLVEHFVRKYRRFFTSNLSYQFRSDDTFECGGITTSEIPVSNQTIVAQAIANIIAEES